jgi:hypothetical protein
MNPVTVLQCTTPWSSIASNAANRHRHGSSKASQCPAEKPPEHGSQFEVISSLVDSESLLALYLEANSAEEWLTLARAEAEFAAFSSQHLIGLADEVGPGARPRVPCVEEKLSPVYAT